ncbi:hypothetical protein L211DRAFT_341362 [Terfezia boudieri ATCC MYA-4762]|uniref:Uncharacterized protein n=1 Tax=Terfezia boudieri ATCC MYA-4762 TaxID=1051890 RepID=A0A3N4LH61_9PEZI|nr:hypothetical protein L211DRAFT_341362 [Terfezia boudieri ATCC MYA-4762]
MHMIISWSRIGCTNRTSLLSLSSYMYWRHLRLQLHHSMHLGSDLSAACLLPASCWQAMIFIIILALIHSLHEARGGWGKECCSFQASPLVLCVYYDNISYMSADVGRCCSTIGMS